MTRQNDQWDALRLQYARRASISALRYSSLNPSVLRMAQERQRAIASHILAVWGADVANLRLTEVGCGAGHNLLEMLRFGFRPEHLIGIELLEDRVQAARTILPQSLELMAGDASAATIDGGSQDIVYQSVVFSSILDYGMQSRLANRMWQWLKPGGAVLWYDFVYDNPQNRDVRGVPIRRIRELFPGGSVRLKRVTLAPPIARAVCALHPSLYGLFNVIPVLRTHLLCWIEKR